jgi:hypothetical protein
MSVGLGGFHLKFKHIANSKHLNGSKFHILY